MNFKSIFLPLIFLPDFQFIWSNAIFNSIVQFENFSYAFGRCSGAESAPLYYWPKNCRFLVLDRKSSHSAEPRAQALHESVSFPIRSTRTTYLGVPVHAFGYWLVSNVSQVLVTAKRRYSDGLGIYAGNHVGVRGPPKSLPNPVCRVGCTTESYRGGNLEFAWIGRKRTSGFFLATRKTSLLGLCLASRLCLPDGNANAFGYDDCPQASFGSQLEQWRDVVFGNVATDIFDGKRCDEWACRTAAKQS